VALVRRGGIELADVGPEVDVRVPGLKRCVRPPVQGYQRGQAVPLAACQGPGSTTGTLPGHRRAVDAFLLGPVLRLIVRGGDDSCADIRSAEPGRPETSARSARRRERDDRLGRSAIDFRPVRCYGNDPHTCSGPLRALSSRVANRHRLRRGVVIEML